MSNIIWKTQEQIDLENNTPQPKTEVEILKENSINLTAIVLDLLMGVI